MSTTTATTTKSKTADSGNNEDVDQKSSKYWYIQGQAYDLEPFLDKHPGGRTLLEMCKGSDCTALFLSVHPRIPTEQMRKPFLVPTEGTSAEEKLKRNGLPVTLVNSQQPYSMDENDYLTFKRGVYDELKRLGLDTHADTHELLLSLVVIIAYFVLYYYMLTTGSYLVAVAFGLTRGVASLCCGHPASHFSFLKGEMNMTLWKIFSPWVLSDVSVWVPSHCISHHVETFVDSDLQDNYPLKRLHPSLKPFFFHKWQHYYVWLVYAVALPFWSLQDLAETTLALVTSTPMKRYYNATAQSKLRTILGLTWSLLFVYYIPYSQHGLRLILVHTIPSSLYVVLSIMVNHEVDIHDHAVGKSTDWAAFQILHSHNFAADSFLACVLTGGLNLQIEHHLFPSLYFTKLFKVRHVVKEYCLKRGLPYNESPNIFVACQKHFRLLKQMSTVPF